MNIRIALSSLSILTALALMGGATFAFFSSEATSQENFFSTGSADLLIAGDVPPGDPDVYGESITGVSFSDIAPGFTEDTLFWLKNNSTGEFSMDTKAELTNLTTGGTDPGDLENALMIKFTCDTDNDGLDVGSDTETVEKSVASWIASPEELAQIGANEGATNASDTSDQDELFCKMTASLGTDAEEEVAGETLAFDGLFKGTQTP